MKVKPVSKQGKVTVELDPRDDQQLEKSVDTARMAASPFRIKKILVPVDFSDFSAKAIDYALPFAEQFQAQIILLHVVEPAISSEEDFAASPAYDEMNRDLIRDAQEQLDALRRDRIGDRAAAETAVCLGRAHSEIVDASKKLAADLIIIATHGYTGLKRVFLGSTAEQVVRQAPCPVLTVR